MIHLTNKCQGNTVRKAYSGIKQHISNKSDKHDIFFQYRK